MYRVMYYVAYEGWDFSSEVLDTEETAEAYAKHLVQESHITDTIVIKLLSKHTK